MATLHSLAERLHLERNRGACPVCGYADAFSVAQGDRGVIGYCFNGCDGRAIAAALRAAGEGDVLERPEDAQEAPKALDAKRKAQEQARGIWAGADPLTGECPASVYLRRRRLEAAIGSPALRYRRDCIHPDRSRYPALVCHVVDAAGKQIGVHRIFLTMDGRKANVDPVKASKGPIWGGAIRFGTGPEIVVAEGPETAIAAGILLGVPAWSSISCGNLARGLTLPPEIGRVVIAADHDAVNDKGHRPGIGAAETAARRWRAEGRVVRIIKPHVEGEDFADVLIRRAEGA